MAFFTLFYITEYSKHVNIIPHAIICKTYVELILDFEIDFWLLLKNSFLVITNLIWLNHLFFLQKAFPNGPAHNFWDETLKTDLIFCNKFYGFSFV